MIWKSLKNFKGGVDIRTEYSVLFSTVIDGDSICITS
jgi:hypothetical protein